MDGHKGKFTGKCSEDESQNTRNQNQSLKSMSSQHTETLALPGPKKFYIIISIKYCHSQIYISYT